MKRILLVSAGAIVLFLGGRALFRALADDETKIRWRVERMVEGYNLGKPGRCVGPLERDWRHADYELDRETLKGALFQVSIQERDRETKELRTRVELVPDSLEIHVEGPKSERRAELDLEAVFARKKGTDGDWEDAWRMRVHAELAKRPDGWKILRSSHQDVRGTQLSR